MIGWLKGTVIIRDAIAGEVILDVGGVGYQVAVSWQTLAEVPEPGQACSLWIHTHVREEALALFGFASPPEKRMFRLLTGVPQVGPKLALAVLGGFPLIELLTAVAAGQRQTLERIPGVGKRTAERILLDLQDKVVPLLETLKGRDTPSTTPTAGPEQDDDGLKQQARLALTNLGWKAKAVDAALEEVFEAKPPPAALDAAVRKALAVLMTR